MLIQRNLQIFYTLFFTIISGTGNTHFSILQGRKIKIPDIHNLSNNHQFYQNTQSISEQSVNIPDLHYGVTCKNTWAIPSNGKHHL